MKTAPTELMPVNAQASVPAVVTPAHMLAMAVEQGADLDRLQKLMDLQERWEASEARKAYVGAMARFKANAPDIVKSKQVSYGNTNYKHALLSDVCSAAIKGLADVGISHSWDIDQSGGTIKVACILTHEMGHSERVSMSAAADTSGQKNAIQGIASAITYLERYTLLAATGLAAREGDNDGIGGPVDTIGPGRVADLEALISEIGVNLAAFLHYMKVDTLGSIPLNRYKVALSALEAKRSHT